MFAITGITGKVGGEAARRLLDADLAVRAVVRDAAKGDAWVERGCEVAVADIRDAEALTAAFSGAEGIFILIPPNFDPAPEFPEVRAIVAALKTALLRAKPGKVVILSTIGAQAVERNLLTQLGIVEQEISRCLSHSRSCALHGSWRMQASISRPHAPQDAFKVFCSPSTSRFRWSRPKTSAGWLRSSCSRPGWAGVLSSLKVHAASRPLNSQPLSLVCWGVRSRPSRLAVQTGKGSSADRA